MKTGKLEATQVWKGELGWCVSHRNSMLSLAFILHIMGNCNGLKLGHLRPQCLHFRRTGNLGVIAGWPGREEGSNCEKGVEISQRNYWHSPGELRWRPKPEQRNKLQMMLWISPHYWHLRDRSWYLRGNKGWERKKIWFWGFCLGNFI